MVYWVNLRRMKELSGQRDHGVCEVGVVDGLADLAFAGLAGGHAAVGQDRPGHTRGREIMDGMLRPGEVRGPNGGTPHFRLTSWRRRSPPQSLTLKGELAGMKSALTPLWQSRWKLSPVS